jgi:ribosomal protein S6--L-glutamate ligase
MKKIIMLNGGSRTRRAFTSGLTHTAFESYKTRNIIVHVKNDCSVTFLQKNIPIDFTDSYVFTRVRNNDEHFCGILYEHLQDIGVAASDPIGLSYKMSEAKISQMPRLARAGIRVPETIIARRDSYNANKEYILAHIAFPLVYKTEGSQGDAVFKIDSQEELDAKIELEKKYELFILQTLIPNTFDTRTIVAYGTVLGSIKRRAQNGNFLNNVAKGGLVSPYTLTSEEADIAVKVSKVCKIDVGGVDFIHTDNGPTVLEINKSPQIAGFESIYGADFVFKSVASLIEKL